MSRTGIWFFIFTAEGDSLLLYLFAALSFRPPNKITFTSNDSSEAFQTGINWALLYSEPCLRSNHPSPDRGLFSLWQGICDFQQSIRILSHFKWTWPHEYTRHLHQYGSMQDGMGIVYPVTPPKLIFPRDCYALGTDVGRLPAHSVQQLMKGKNRCKGQDLNERPGFAPKYFRFRSRGSPCSAILPNRWILFQCTS